MAERYDVVLDGQLGERRGTLTWTETDGRLTGTFTLFGIDNPVIGRRSGAVLELTHTLRTAVSLLRCCTYAELRGRMVNAIFRYPQIYCSAGTSVGFSSFFAFVNRSLIVHYRRIHRCWGHGRRKQCRPRRAAGMWRFARQGSESA